MVLTVMPRAPRLLASDRVSTFSAPLVIEYTVCGVTNQVVPEEMLMIRPPSRSRGSARWMMKNGARTLIANSRSNSSGVARSMVPAAEAMAALFTKMSSGLPSSPAVSAVKRVSMSPADPSSACTGKA
jgi:hypothetical protein